MNPSLASFSPENRVLVAPGVQVFAAFTTSSGTTGRSITVKINGVSVATWAGGVVTSTPPYVLTVSNVPSRVAVTLDRTGGWPAGAYSWVVDYADSAGITDAFAAFAVTTYTAAVFAPSQGQTGVSRRPSVYASFDISAGTPLGVDLYLDGEPLVEGGALVRPSAEGATGGSGTRVFAGARPRRGFRWGSRVTVTARPRVGFGGVAFLGSYEYALIVGERPASPSAAASGGTPLEGPVAEAARQITATYLRPRAASPPLGTALRRVLGRSTVGQLAPAAIRRTPVALYPEDDPGDAALIGLARAAAPLWGALADALAPPEEREALDAAWRSGHPVEQAGAVCLLVLYGIEGRASA